MKMDIQHWTMVFVVICSLMFIPTSGQTNSPSASNCTSSYQCSNGGSCYYGSCLCAVGYSGAFCQYGTSTYQTRNSSTYRPSNYTTRWWQRTTTTIPNWMTSTYNYYSCAYRGCRNGGSCFYNSTTGSYQCYCPSAYTGTFCETYRYPYVTTTTPKPSVSCHNYGYSCLNGGSCNYSGKCYCPSYYTGDRCEKAKECTPYNYLCRNGGICYNFGRCNCTMEYDGTYCQKTRNCSSSYPCRNGGTCYHGSCYCIGGYSGRFCQYGQMYSILSTAGHSTYRPSNYTTPSTKQCNSYNDRCLNGGYCNYQGICSCNSHYTGSRCEKEKECTPTNYLCYNGGKCYLGKCNCAMSYEGPFCQKIRNCSSSLPCLNGGTCYHSNCYCTGGYAGRFCQHTNHTFPGPCACKYGDCHSNTNGTPSCVCYPGYIGQFCETKIPGTKNVTEGKWCRPVNPCTNNGICIGDAYDYTCKCDSTKYYGTHCERQFVKCEYNGGQCHNGGKCKSYALVHDNKNIGQCLCASGFKGDHCQTDINEFPHWMKLFSETRKWSGTYSYNRFLIPFTFVVKTMSTAKGVIIASMKDKQTEIEMKGYSIDDFYVTFNTTKVKMFSPRIPKYLELSGQFFKNSTQNVWIYKGKVTKPNTAIFGTFSLRPAPNSPQQSSQKEVPLQVGLGVGIPVIVIVAVVLVVLALSRKGVIFRSSSAQFEPTRFSNSEQNVNVNV